MADDGFDRVIDWRRHCFLELGFERHVAAFLSTTQIELAAARKLHQAGCPLDLIAIILHGTGPNGIDIPSRPPLVYDEEEKPVAAAAS